jgi:hypothetical protein
MGMVLLRAGFGAVVEQARQRRTGTPVAVPSCLGMICVMQVCMCSS